MEIADAELHLYVPIPDNAADDTSGNLGVAAFRPDRTAQAKIVVATQMRSRSELTVLIVVPGHRFDDAAAKGRGRKFTAGYMNVQPDDDGTPPWIIQMADDAKRAYRAALATGS